MRCQAENSREWRRNNLNFLEWNTLAHFAFKCVDFLAFCFVFKWQNLQFKIHKTCLFSSNTSEEWHSVTCQHLHLNHQPTATKQERIFCGDNHKLSMTNKFQTTKYFFSRNDLAWCWQMTIPREFSNVTGKNRQQSDRKTKQNSARMFQMDRLKNNLFFQH